MPAATAESVNENYFDGSEPRWTSGSALMRRQSSGHENSNYTVRYFGHHWHGGLTFTVLLILVRRSKEEVDVTLLLQLR